MNQPILPTDGTGRIRWRKLIRQLESGKKYVLRMKWRKHLSPAASRCGVKIKTRSRHDGTFTFEVISP